MDRNAISLQIQFFAAFSRSGACSGGGTSPPSSFSTLGGRALPAGPICEPGEIAREELYVHGPTKNYAPSSAEYSGGE